MFKQSAIWKQLKNSWRCCMISHQCVIQLESGLSRVERKRNMQRKEKKATTTNSKWRKNQIRFKPFHLSQRTSPVHPQAKLKGSWRASQQNWNPHQNLNGWVWKQKANAAWWKRAQQGRPNDNRGVGSGAYQANQWASWSRRRNQRQSFSWRGSRVLHVMIWFLLNVDSLRSHLKGYSHDLKEVINAPEDTPWPLIWMLVWYSRKHTWCSTKQLDLKSFRHVVLLFGNKMRWSWFFRNE
jgi:hypothetical protein